MEFIHGLELNLENVNEILNIAQQKGYVKLNEKFFKSDNSRILLQAGFVF